MPEDLFEKIVSLAKRRGFIFPSSEIYGGFRSSYDYGPLGVLLKNNVKKLWWDEMLLNHENIVGLDAAILMNPKVWQASGHTSAGFADELVECTSCHKRFRLEHTQGTCPDCSGKLTKPKKFNLLVRTYLGPIEDESALAYFRPETAQGIYVNFESVRDAMRLKLPFGVAQMGKAFRNEITPGPFIFRMREFEQMEMQFFCDPRKKTASPGPCEWFECWKNERLRWYVDTLGISKNHLRFHPHTPKELAHYAKAAVDIEYNYPWGWGEFEGIHNRGDWDLKNHMESSGKDLRYFDEDAGERFIPHIIETSAGTDRCIFVLLLENYREEEVRGERRVVLQLPPQLAPIKISILPLLKNDERLVSKAREILGVLRTNWPAMYDEVGSIGRRYRRQDEIGTPYAVTIDHQTIDDDTVTIRDRDTMEQQRINTSELANYLKTHLDKCYVTH